MLSKWRGQLWEGADVVFDPKIRDKSKNKIKELESLIGRQTIAIDFLKRAEQYVA
jgi:hypothetical protein